MHPHHIAVTQLTGHDYDIGRTDMSSPLSYSPVLLLALLACTASFCSAAQETKAPLVAGDRLSFHSSILGEDRELLVALPRGYDDNTEVAYPLLIVLDGETHFQHAAGLIDFLSHRDVAQIPAMVVVGIPNTNRLRDVTPTATERFPDAGGVQRFLDFVEREALPLLTRNYRITGQRLMAGHSGSGLAVFVALQRFGTHFRSYIAIDPSLDWDGGIALREFEEFLDYTPELPVFFSFSSYKPKAETGMLLSVLERIRPAGLRWSVNIYEGETHNSMVHGALRDALVATFEDEAR